MADFLCEVCGSSSATHVLVDYQRTVCEPSQYFCKKHAFEEGREECHICEDNSHLSSIAVEDEDGEQRDLLPTYRPGELDRDGMCSEHP
ncbi:Uncharacterised protein [Achromobacter sp. 2789STDY5608615]|nr:Uncharacterised protein [Achromobacter sp. 2789STDY5608615]